MVRQNVDNNFDAVAIGAVGQSAEVVTGAELVIADLPVDRLVVVIPFTFDRVAFLTEKSHSAVLADEAGVGRRGLHVGESGVGNLLHVGRDGVERPCEGMENDVVVGAAFAR